MYIEQQKANYQEKIFILLCNEDDRRRLNHSIPLDINNYERLCCIIDALGFKDYLMMFIHRNTDLESQLISQIDNRLSILNDEIFEKEKREELKWLIEFSNHQGSETLKSILRELFEIEGETYEKKE